MRIKHRYFYITGIGITLDNKSNTWCRHLKTVDYPSQSYLRKKAIEQHGFAECTINSIHEFKTKTDYESFIK